MELKSNPGGIIPVEGIIGRNALCESAWNTLDVQSVMMTAERRIGKTSVLRKMAAEAPRQWVVLSRDLESLHTASDFANSVYNDVEQHLSKWKRTALKARQLLTNLGGVDVGGIIKLPTGHATPWKPLLTQAIEDLIAEQQDSRLVFFWDEVPFMLQGVSSTIEFDDRDRLLDLLRLLERDHYLKRRDGGYTWKFPLIARWWRLDRDLQQPEV